MTELKNVTVYTVQEAMEILKIGQRRTIYKYIADGRIKAAKIGRDYRILESDLEDFLINTGIINQQSIDLAKRIMDLPAEDREKVLVKIDELSKSN